MGGACHVMLDTCMRQLNWSNCAGLAGYQLACVCVRVYVCVCVHVVARDAALPVRLQGQGSE